MCPKPQTESYHTVLVKRLLTGIPGCGAHLCNSKGGFCGGGGYVLSRGAMKHIMSPNVEAQQRKKK